MFATQIHFFKIHFQKLKISPLLKVRSNTWVKIEALVLSLFLTNFSVISFQFLSDFFWISESFIFNFSVISSGFFCISPLLKVRSGSWVEIEALVFFFISQWFLFNFSANSQWFFCISPLLKVRSEGWSEIGALVRRILVHPPDSIFHKIFNLTKSKNAYNIFLQHF